MNLLPWNIVRKDFRLTRIYLVVWWGILAASLFNIRWCLNEIISEPEALYNNAHGDYAVMLTDYFAWSLPFYLIWVFIALGLILLIALVDIVIKADSPIDERAEWRTRPVSGLGVWRAKLFYFGFFCFLLPGAIFTLAYVMHGGRLAEAAQGLAQWGIMLACIIAAVASAGVLFQRTFLGLLVFVAMAMGFFLLGLANVISDDTFENLSLSFHEGWLNAWVAMGLFVITGLAVSALSYGGRRQTLCRVVFGGGVLMAIIAVWVAPQRFLMDPTLPRQQDDRVKLTLVPASKQPPLLYVHPLSRARQSRTDQWTEYDGFQVQVSYQALGTEACLIDSFYWKFTFSNPGAKPPNEPRVPMFIELGMFNLAPAVAAVGYGELSKYPYNDNILSVSLGEKAALQKLGPGTVKWEGHYFGKTGHLEVVSDEPYVDGAAWGSGLKMFKIAFEHLPLGFSHSQISWPSQLGQIDFNRWEVNAANLQWLASPPPPADPRSQIVLLYNPVKRQSIQGSMYIGGNIFEENGNISIYSLKRGTAFFDLTEILGEEAFPHRITSAREVSDWVTTHADLIKQYRKTLADWLANARLIELRFVPDRAIYNTVTIDAIPLTAAAPAASSPTP